MNAEQNVAEGAPATRRAHRGSANESPPPNAPFTAAGHDLLGASPGCAG